MQPSQSSTLSLVLVIAITLLKLPVFLRAEVKDVAAKDHEDVDNFIGTPQNYDTNAILLAYFHNGQIVGVLLAEKCEYQSADSGQLCKDTHQIVLLAVRQSIRDYQKQKTIVASLLGEAIKRQSVLSKLRSGFFAILPPQQSSDNQFATDLLIDVGLIPTTKLPTEESIRAEAVTRIEKHVIEALGLFNGNYLSGIVVHSTYCRKSAGFEHAISRSLRPHDTYEWATKV